MARRLKPVVREKRAKARRSTAPHRLEAAVAGTLLLLLAAACGGRDDELDARIRGESGGPVLSLQGGTASERALAERRHRALLPVHQLLYEETETTPQRVAEIWVAIDELLSVLNDAVPPDAIDRAESDLRDLMGRCLQMLQRWGERSTVTLLRRAWEERRARWYSPETLAEIEAGEWPPPFPRSSAALDAVQDARRPAEVGDLEANFVHALRALEGLHEISVVVQTSVEQDATELVAVERQTFRRLWVARQADLVARLVLEMMPAPETCLYWSATDGARGGLASLRETWNRTCRARQSLESWSGTPWEKEFLRLASSKVTRGTLALRKVRQDLLALEILPPEPSLSEDDDDETIALIALLEDEGLQGLAQVLASNRPWPRLEADTGSKRLIAALLRAASEEIGPLRASSTLELLQRLRSHCQIADRLRQTGGFRNEILGVSLRWSVGQRLAERVFKVPHERPVIASFLRSCPLRAPSSRTVAELVAEELGPGANAEKLRLSDAPMSDKILYALAVAVARARGREGFELSPATPATAALEPRFSSYVWLYLSADHQNRKLGGLLRMITDNGVLDRDVLPTWDNTDRNHCYICGKDDYGKRLPGSYRTGKLGYMDIFWNRSFVEM